MKRRTFGEKYGMTSVVKKTNQNDPIIPEVLYKYMTLGRFFGSFNKYLTGNLWFSDWESMNDPMEGAFDLSMGNAVDITNIDQMAENRKLQKKREKKHLKKAKVCSLSYYKNSLPMWAHYANNHTGVCIGIKINKLKLENNKIKLRKIVYDRLNRYVKEMGTKDILEVLSHKLDDWKYENEWRLIIINGKSGMRQVGEVKEIILGRKCKLAHSKCFLWPENIKEKVSIFILETDWGYNESDNTIEITGYKGSERNIAIPSMITVYEDEKKDENEKGKPVVAIGYPVFPYNEITSIKIPDSIIEINKFAFESCAKLRSIKVVQENSKYSSKDGVLFSKNFDILIRYPCGKKDTCYKIPDSVKTIADFAFENCTKLIRVNIHSNVTDIGHLAFYGCTKLKSIDVDKTNPKYSSQDGVLFDKEMTSLITYPGGKKGTCYQIPESVRTIAGYAFENCTKLIKVSINGNVTDIRYLAFSGCVKLKCIDVNRTNSKYSSQDGVLFNKEITCLIACPGGKKGTYKIPDGVTEIENCAFSGCTKLKAVTIPDSLETIGYRAFSHCTNLTTVYFVNSKNPEIGYRAFFDCNLDKETLDDFYNRFGKEDFIRITGLDYQAN